MTNPYQPIDIAIEPLPVTARKEASLIWFAAPVAVVLTGWYLALFTRYNPDIDAVNAFFESLQDAGSVTIAALAVYAAIRHLFRQRFDYASTGLSLVLVGILVSSCLVVVAYWGWFRDFRYNWVTSIRVSTGVLFSFFVVTVERLITRITDIGVVDQTVDEIPVRSQTRHASIFWYSAAIFVAVCGTAMIGEKTRPNIDKLIGIASMVCLVSTAAYGLLSACFKRVRPATSVARVVAAIAYIAAMFGEGYLLSGLTTTWVVPFLFFGPAVIAVPADRLVSRFAASD